MIFCFSACGNTALVAEHLAGILGEKIVRINSFAEDSFNLSEHKRIIWAFPVYSWGIPAKVKDYINRINLTVKPDTPHFMVATCGDDAGLTAEMWRKSMKKKGWFAKSAHTVIMPNTYVILPGFNVDTDDVIEKKLSGMPERVREIAHAIKCNSSVDKVTQGKFAWLKTRIIYPFFMRFLTSPTPFRAEETCTSCGKCSKVCPTGNIVIENGRPKWGSRCTMCLACYHHCPQKSVAYGHRTKGKGQYTAPHSLNQ